MDLEALIQGLSRPQVFVPALMLLGGLAGGLVLGWSSGHRSRRTGLVQADHDLADEARDLRKTVYILQNENRNLSTFLATMPDLARQLNSRLEKRKVPELLIGFIEQLFDAEQIAVFLTSADGRHLVLAGGKGVAQARGQHKPIPFGEGRLGWVAEHRMAMDENDFQVSSRLEPLALSSSAHPMFRVELCAPLAAETQTHGVISIGGLLRRPKNEKNMLKMVADLGSIAIQNTSLLRRLQDSANSDGLTGLTNKRHFMDKLGLELVKAGKEQTSLSLFLFDIDHFKHYNDNNGHLAGDEALRIMSRLIESSVRPEDIAARYGGEEFVVLLPNTDKAGAIDAAEKVRRMVEQHPFPHQDKQPLGNVTISGGVATFPFDAGNTADLIRRADQALYAGKHAGRNRVRAFQPQYFSPEESSTTLEEPATGRQGA